jgi:hypothetical protein
MSVSGRYATNFHGECQDNEAVDRILKPLRMTPSASSALRSERGVRGILASFPKQTQNSLRRLLSERFMIEAKLRAVRTRQECAPQPTDDTDDMRRLKLALRDSNYNLKKLVGVEALPHVLALLGEPDVNDSMILAVGSEDDARTTYDDGNDAEKAARGWRLTVGSAGHRVGLTSQYRYASHDSPNHKGQRSLVNQLNSATGEEGLSYYQTVQLRHGRTRSGSCGYAGVQSEVFGPGGIMRSYAEPVPISRSSPRGDAGGGQGFGDNESAVSWGQRSQSPRRILTSSGQVRNDGGASASSSARGRTAFTKDTHYLSTSPGRTLPTYTTSSAAAGRGGDSDNVLDAAEAAMRALAAAQGLDEQRRM